jgi:drug/metabolite transporter (DMT)-like permease
VADGVARGIVFALFTATLYGAVPVAARLANDAGVNGLEIVTLRALAVVVALGPLALVARAAFRMLPQARKAYALLVIATCMVSCGLMAAIQFIPVSVAVLVFYSFPILIALTAPFVEGQGLTLFKLALAVLAFLGLAFALAPEMAGLDVRGLLLAGVAAVGYALQLFAGRMMSPHLKPLPLAVLVHVAVIPIGIVLVLVTGGGAGVHALVSSHAAVVAVMATGVLYCAAYLLHMSAVAHAPAAVVAPCFNIEPVVSTVLAAVVLGESLSRNHMIGGLVVLAAVVVSSWPERTRTA